MKTILEVVLQVSQVVRSGSVVPQLILGIQGAICVLQDPVKSTDYVYLTTGTDQTYGSVTSFKGIILVGCQDGDNCSFFRQMRRHSLYCMTVYGQ
jgi:hypothetical protein